MRKRLALFTAALGIIAAGVVAFMAFESYTLDINAHLEPVLSVNPHGDWNLGIVYPETDVSTKLFVGLSNSAKTDRNFIAVEYIVSCQPKPLDENSIGFAVLNGTSNGPIVLNLCPNITVTDQATGAVLCITNNPCLIPLRTLTAASQQDGYLVAIKFPDCIGAHQKEPGVKEVNCNLDPATGKYFGVNLGAQISIQVLLIDQEEKCITRKDRTELPDCVKLPPTPTPAEELTPTPAEEPTPTPTPELPDLQAEFDGFTEGINGLSVPLQLRAAGNSFSCEIHFTIMNVNPTDAGASTTLVTKDGSGDAFVLTPPIPGGDSHSDSAMFPDSCFNLDLSGSITADIFDEVPENDETNNVFEFFVPANGDR